MTLDIGDAKRILRANKVLMDIHPWVSKPTRDGKCIQYSFESRIRADSSMPRGLWFRITVFPRYPDTTTFQMECDIPNSRSHMPLYRLDYRPIHTHSNSDDWGPMRLRGLFFEFGETHEHICLYHAIPKLKRLRSGGVHTARRIKPDFLDFDSALEHVCSVLNIQNGGMIPDRNAQGELL